MKPYQEGSPIEGIAGLEQFGYWVADYRARLLSDPAVPIVSQMPTEFSDSFSDSGMKQGTHTFLLNCPWNTVPQSIQEILALQYESATLLGEKYLHVLVHPAELWLQLTSPLIKRSDAGQIDIIGEHSSNGLILQTNPGYLHGPGWIVTHAPATSDPLATLLKKLAARLREPIRQERLFGKIEEDQNQESPVILPYPATVNQLQDFARFLKESKDKAVVVRI